MKTFTFTLLAFLFMATSFAQNNLCNSALPFCTGTTYIFPAGVNSGAAEVGPNYGCLLSQPNPAWYYMKVDQSGPINFHISTDPAQDVDFVCWGPFTSPSAGCSGLTAACTSCPSNVADSTFYPSGNMADCSYSVSWQEDCHISGALANEYYIIMITNYSNMACNIIFEQTNLSAPQHGTIDNTILGITPAKTPTTKGNLTVFPNPASGAFAVSFDNPNQKPHTIYLKDMAGRTHQVFENVSTGTFVIHTGLLPKGTYIIEVSGDKKYQGKVVIE